MTHLTAPLAPLLSFALLASALAAASPVTAAPPASHGPPVPAPAGLALTPCQLQHPERIASVTAECGVLSVPENPARPEGRRIGLYVARVPAINKHKSADPLFVLAGGPGMAATTFYTTVAPVFARVHRDRDIVLVDQRGTGRSNALNCELSDDLLTQETDAQVVAEAARCLKDTSAHADVAYYTTSVAVQDLDTVRAALGYDRINLYGGSYGTRVAQHYLRRFPTHTRTVILDGVVPPTLALGPAVAVDAQNALLRILARCTREPQCQSRFGDPVADYHKLSAQMRIQPVPITIADPTTGEQSKLELSTLQLATVLRLTTYTPQEAALLPLILHRASESGDFMPLATQYLLISRSLGDQLSYGMHNSVVCAEDVPFYNEKTIDRKLLEQTYLGTSAVDGLRDICQVWPRGPIDKDFHEPLHSDVPALLLSGSDDPATPVADAQEALRGFTQGLHVVLKGFGHGQLVAPCVDRIMARFIETGTVNGLDVSCTSRDKPTPFFISLNGPPP
ncbi:MAG TPA: alpha/beta hydrolase [Steroidobacteraceae bacterium]|nr:alpha/beta hydrolase [Steroidobacteraceae bacterium]